MSQGHRFDPTVLREYDIRGIVGDTLHVVDAHALGRTFGSIVGERGGSRVCVGFDGRLTSPDMAEALIDGLRKSGISVVCIGLGPTPMLYFASKVLGADGGIMITGSHNPSEYNGFKMVLENGPFWGESIQMLGEHAQKGDWRTGDGGFEEVDILERYVDRLVADCRIERALRIAWDAGNGAAGVALGPLTDRLPGEHTLLHAEVDGTFPAHHPDPTVPENLEDLCAAVAKQGCDLGIAFDGDGDRIGVVDGKGRILWGDQILALLARDLLRQNPGASIIADVKASAVVFDEIARCGGQPVMSATGHSIVKSKMVEIGAPLAGEMSGHIFYGAPYYGFDDALYAAVRLIDIVARSGGGLDALRDSLPQMCNTPEVRFEVAESRKFAIAEEVKARLLKTDAQVSTVDGVRVSTADGWWLLRASNTQNVLVVRCESATEEGLARLKQAVVEQLRESGVEAPASF
jgi:phosphomannomutase